MNSSNQSEHVEWKAVKCTVERIFFNPTCLAYMYVCVFTLLERSLGKDWRPPPGRRASFPFQEASFEIFPVFGSLKESHQILLNLLINMENRGDYFFSPLNYLQWELKKKTNNTTKPDSKKMIQNKRQNTFFKQVTRQNLYLWHVAKITPIVTLSCANVKKHIFFFWTEDI